MNDIRCGGPEFAEYAVGRLPLERSRLWDRHLVVCQRCVGQIWVERRLHDSLTAAPRPSSSLHAQLLAMGNAGPSLQPDASPFTVPKAHAAFRPDALPLMTPTAPPAHRSAFRSVVLASTVAGLGVSAVWSLTAIGGGGVETVPASSHLPVAVMRTVPVDTPDPSPDPSAGVQGQGSARAAVGGRGFVASPASWRLLPPSKARSADSTTSNFDRAESTP